MYIEEKELRNYPNIISFECTERILEQMKNQICNIKLTDGTIGTGFFCKIPFPTKDKMLPVLVTNNHLINEKLLENKDGLIMLYTKDSNKFQNFILNNRKYYTNKEYDITLIEIKENSDEIYNYLELDENLLGSIFDNNPISQDNLNNYFIGETIYIIQYPEGKLSVSYGIVEKITDNQKYNFNHLCSTKQGSSGSPILNIKNNKLLGIHKKSSINGNYNKGTFLNIPIKEFIRQNFKENIPDFIFNNNIAQNEIKEVKKVKEIKDIKEKIKEIKEMKEIKEEVKEIEEVKELKSMTLEEFNEKFRLAVKLNTVVLDLREKNCGNDIFEIIYSMKFTNLYELFLGFNSISNIDFLSKFQFQKLEILDLKNNVISDISVLQNAKFPKLKKLYLNNNHITDISAFEKVNFVNLEELCLQANNISDITVLEKINFPKLKSLYLCENKISDISVFEKVKFPKLSVLHLFSNNFDQKLFSSLIKKLKASIKFCRV